MRAAKGHAKRRASGAAWVAKASVVNFHHAREEIGITQAALNNYLSKLGESDEPIYKNKKCTIRKGTLYVKPTTRGRKKQ